MPPTRIRKAVAVKALALHPTRAAAARHLGVTVAELAAILTRPPGNPPAAVITAAEAQRAFDAIATDGGAAVRALGVVSVAKALKKSEGALRAKMRAASATGGKKST